MPAESFQIKRYTYYQFAAREGNTQAVALCYGDNGAFLAAHFDGGAHPLQPAQKLADNRYIFHYRTSALESVVDMLRNESPVYCLYIPEGQNNSRITTSSEPVGEGEVP